MSEIDHFRTSFPIPHSHCRGPHAFSYPASACGRLRRGGNTILSSCTHLFRRVRSEVVACRLQQEHCARQCEELAPFSPRGRPSQSFSFRSRSARPERVGQSRLARARPATTKSNPSPALHFPIQAAGSHLLGRPVARHAPVPRFSVYFGTSATGESRAAFGWVSSQIRQFLSFVSSSIDISPSISMPKGSGIFFVSFPKKLGSLMGRSPTTMGARQ